MASELSYWRESSRPLPSLMFVAPMIVVYEIGTVWMGAQAPRNGADVWLRSLLGQIGFAQHFLLPLLTCGLLLAWHHMRQEQWQVQWPVVSGMLIESALLGMLLLVLANGMSSLLATSAPTPMALGQPWLLGRIVGYLGAGIYEELLFRLLLMPPAIRLLQSGGMTRRWSWFWASCATSLLFALAHYELNINVLGCRIAWPGEAMDHVTFAFRALAGGIFSALFLLRGFGIAAGAHALYDIFVAVL